MEGGAASDLGGGATAMRVGGALGGCAAAPARQPLVAMRVGGALGGWGGWGTELEWGAQALSMDPRREFGAQGLGCRGAWLAAGRLGRERVLQCGA